MHMYICKNNTLFLGNGDVRKYKTIWFSFNKNNHVFVKNTNSAKNS